MATASSTSTTSSTATSGRGSSSSAAPWADVRADADRLEIPSAGLHHVLTAWLGRGDLLDLLGRAVPDLPREWEPGHLRRRAEHVTFLRVRPVLDRWPARVRDWIDVVPSTTKADRIDAPAPAAGTAWASTAREHGWPPSRFVVRSRHRDADNDLVDSLAWTLTEVDRLARVATRVDATALAGVEAQVKAAREVMAWQALARAKPSRPSPPVVAMLEHQGGVWRAVAAVVRLLRELDSPQHLAAALLVPVEEARPVFFQLGVLGEVIVALRGLGATVVSTGPIGGATGGEVARVETGGRTLHLWFEAGGAWSRYGATPPHRTLTEGLYRQTRPVSPDVLLIEPGRSALSIECKYSRDPDYVGRHGVAQAALYAVELSATVAPRVVSYVVARESATRMPREVPIPAGTLGLAGPSHLATVVSGFLAAPAATP